MKTKMKFARVFFGLLIITSLSIACTKEGGQGPIGPQGEQGSEGATGTANIIYSKWFPSEFSDDIELSTDSFTIEAPDLTDEIVEKGLLLVFGRTINVIDDALVEQLPRTVFFRNQYYYHRYISNPATSDPQQFEIIVESMDGSFVGTPFFDEYRYFIIPGSIPTSGKSWVDYTKMSYKEIVELYNIPE